MAKKWSKSQFRLPENHGWRTSRPGNAVFVAERGAAQFEFPSGWIIDPHPNGGSIRLRDKPEPDDNFRLEISLIKYFDRPDPPPGTPAVNIDWSGLPLMDLFKSAFMDGDKRDVIKEGKIEEGRRRNLELLWRQIEFMDPGENRKAFSRQCLARGNGIHAIITMEFWPEDASLGNRVWRGALATLKLGEYISDPSQVHRMN